jgi:tRNA pseudouridine38-40 synthase
MAARLRLDLAYDGTDFSGWAAQPGRRTVQGELERSLAAVLRLDGVSVTCAGRTDAGVHAVGQVCHVDVPRAPDLDALRRQLAAVLPADIRVREVTLAPEGFDARFSALWRRYAYRICDDPPAADPLQRHRVLVWKRRLDVAAMNDACRPLLGEHDFAAYCRRREGATTVRTLRELSWSRTGASVTARVVADAFCHSMVRALVGAAIAVGEGRLAADVPGQVLAAGVRDPRVTVVAPHGLTLEEVAYPADADVASRAATARARRGATP